VYANATWTYHDGDWTGSCSQQDDSWWQSNDTWYNTTTTFAYSPQHPPHWPPFDTKSPPAVGQNLTTWFLSGCAIQSSTNMYNGTGTASTTVNGAPTTVPTFTAVEYPTYAPYSFSSAWRQDSGLVLSWAIAEENSGGDGKLTSIG
jgi:hypothetical protein